MVKKVFVTELVDNSPIQTVFLVAKKSVRETRNGDPYLSLTLSDSSGSIEARAWDNAPVLDSRVQEDDFAVVTGRVSSYRGELQLTITDLDRVPDEEVDLADFLPRSRWEPKELFRQLRELIDGHVRSAELRRFFDALFADEDWNLQYVRAPAAVSNHHNYLGGLVEHTLSMARIAVGLTEHYRRYYPGMLNPDLVIAGCVLHDMGKCDELNFRRSFSYSTQGRLVGHIVRGVEIVNEVAARTEPAFEEHMLMQLKHLILSHHGKQEYGSPVTPRTPEAILLHEIDMIDSRMNACFKVLAPHQATGDGASPPDGAWTDYHRNFDGSLYVSGDAGARWEAAETMSADDLVGPGVAKGDDADGADRTEPTSPQETPSRPPGASARRSGKAATSDDAPAAPKDTMTLQLFGD